MSATDELRRLLDERGVEHYDGTSGTLWLRDEHGYRASADEMTSGMISLHIWCTTPQQAIDATLGSEECHFEVVERFVDGRNLRADRCRCDNCGYQCARGFIRDERFKYCPNCGRRIVEVDE